MKRLLHISLAILLIIVVIRISAETVQTGTVKEYREKAQKTPLAGVELNVRSAQSTVSDKNGNFNLKFLTLKPGEKINVRNIEKMGYVIFNKDAVDQWNLNPNQPFTIVMCAASKFKQLKDQYYSNASRQYSAQYQKAQAELKQLKEQNKLKDSEYQARLKEIQDDYDRRLDNLDNYIDRFARIDMSELSEEEQKIIDLVREGDIEAAIQRYQKLNLLDKTLSEIEDINIIDAAIDTLSATREEKTGNLTQLLESLRRQIETLQLAGDYRNNDTIASIYTRVADAYPSNTYWLLETASFLKDICRYDDAMKYYFIAWDNIISNPKEDITIITDLYTKLGILENAMGNYSIALDYFKESLRINIELQGEANFWTAQDYNNIALIYNELGMYLDAEVCIRKAIRIIENLEDASSHYFYLAKYLHNLNSILRHLRKYDEAEIVGLKALSIKLELCASNSPDVAETYINLANLYDDLGNHAKSIEYIHDALNIYLQYYGENDPTVAIIYDNLGTVYTNMDNFLEAYLAYRKSLKICYSILPSNHPFTGECLNNMGVLLNQYREYSEASNFLIKALDIFKTIYEQDHPRIASTLINLAFCFYGLADFEKALDYCDKALDIYLSHNDPDKWEIGRTLRFKGSIYNKVGNGIIAHDCLKRALEIFVEIDPQSLETAYTYKLIGNSQELNRNYNDAIVSYTEAINLYKEIYGPNNSFEKEIQKQIDTVSILLKNAE